ncbi:MAG: S8 family serine peptidase [candidate division Zixibacteria bacterium]|nr:S8 family serine peptidase [candidate division Zixibacteria bacterium]
MYRRSNSTGAVVLSLMLCAAGLLVAFTSANAGTIEPPLNELIAENDSGEKIGAIIIMSDRIDNEKLNNSLIDRKADNAQRHYEVITTLKRKATLTQGPVLRMLDALEAEGKASNIKNYWIANMISFEGNAEAIKKIASMPEIEKVIFDMPVEMMKPIIGDSAPPMTTYRSPMLDVINAPAVWAMGYTGAGRLVSNIDTGVDGTHPALSSRWRGNNGHPTSECWFDPVENTTYPTDHGEGDVPHGTHTMGTICGRSATTYDTVGVAMDAQWIAAATVDYGGTTSDLIQSFEWIADPDGNPITVDDVPDVVGNSWGWSPFWAGYEHCDDTFWDVMDGCENAGVAVIFSAGNEGDYGGSNVPNSLRTPADRATTYYNAFAVGSVNGHNASYPISGFSSRGPCQCGTGDLNIKPECVAPGENIYSSVPGGYESNWSGTSMASPHISGSVAILRQINPGLRVDEIKQILIQSCIDLGTTGEDNWYGHGILDLEAAAQLAMTGIGFIDGYVRDATYNSPLPAVVQIAGTSIVTTANGSGYYLLAASPDTTYTIRASYSGYESVDNMVYVVENDTAASNFYLPAPLVDYYPVSYNVSVSPGNSTQRDLVIKNIGAGSLSFNLWTTADSRLLLDNGSEIPVSIKQSPLGYYPADQTKADSKPEPYFPPMILSQGGPDAFGHMWIDSDEPGGPSVNWVDISGPGTSVALDDDDYTSSLSIGFNFPFYDNTYSSLAICSNGMLSFSGGSSNTNNTNLPDSDSPNNQIAMWWDDLDPSDGGNIYYYRDTANNRFIVSFVNVPNYIWFGDGGSLSFQAILYPSGKIELNYATMNPGDDNLSSSTIGIENYNASDGLPIVYNASYMHSNLSIAITAAPEWLTALPGSGYVPAGDSVIAAVAFDAVELTEGIYTGNINLDSNDPNDPNIDIPVTLNVTETPTPLIELSAYTIYDTVYSGYSTAYDLIISNTGTADLDYNAADNRSWMSEYPTNGNVSPSQSDTVEITFDAASLSPGSYSGTVAITSNDPNNSTINIPCYLYVSLLITDDVGVTEIINPPDSIANGLPYEIEIEAANFGLDAQTFNAVIEVRVFNSSTVIFTDTLTVSNLQSGTIDTFTFADAFTPSDDTIYTFEAYTTLVSDQVPGNDMLSKDCRSVNFVSVWYGNLDGSPVYAPIGYIAYVDVYMMTPSDVYIADMLLCLGTDDQYVDSLLSQAEGEFYYPLTEWSVAEFLAPEGSPPNPAGWSNQSFMGWARLGSQDKNPWLHETTPTHVITFAIKIVDDDGLVGRIEPAIGEGINYLQGGSNAGDTSGGAGYPLSENFSELQFFDVLLTDDVGASKIFSPPDSMVVLAPYQVEIEITNYGSDPQTFDAIVEVFTQGSSSAVFADTITITGMPAFSADTITFAESFTPDVESTYTFIAYTILPSDQRPSNDNVSKDCQSFNMVSVWYGNIDSSPVYASIGNRTDVDVYALTPPEAYVADMLLCLGTDDQYIDSLLSQAEGVVYYPLTQWAATEFLTPDGSPPNPSGWSNQSFMGWARLSAEDDNPWLHAEAPIKILTYVVKIVDNAGLLNQVLPAIGTGLNTYQGPSNMGDTLGYEGYPVMESFSEFHFIESFACDYLPGDINGDKVLMGSDATYGVRYFKGMGTPPPDSCYNTSASEWLYAAADCNGDCFFMGSDIVYIVAYFKGENQPPQWCPQTPPLSPPVMGNDGGVSLMDISGE